MFSKILEKASDVIEQGLGVALLIVMFASVLIQIFFRYVLKTPLTWTEEASRYSFIWTVLLGAAFAVRRREHVVMDVLVKKFPAALQKQISLILNIIILLSLIYLLPISWKFFWFMKNVSAPTMKISWGFLFFSAPLSILLMTIHTLMGLINAMRRGEEKKTFVPR